MPIFGKGTASQGGRFIDVLQRRPGVSRVEICSGRRINGKCWVVRRFGAAVANNGETFEFHNAGRIIFLYTVHKRIICSRDIGKMRGPKQCGLGVKGQGSAATWEVLLTEIKLSTLAGRTGGRTDSRPQPKRTLEAAPQMRPWQAPMPQRDWSLASRQLPCCFTCPKVTSSQRQSSVSSIARVFNSGRKANASASNRRNLCQAARRANRAWAFSFSSVAT